jgi:Zeta toxin
MVPKQEQQQEDKKTVLATSKELIRSSISTTNSSKSSKRRRTQPDSTSCTNSTTTSSEGTSFLSSTEESYGVNNLEFYGPFAHIRRDYIDYSYHSNYKISRQRFQNCIIWELLDPGRVVVSNNKNNSSSSAPSSSSSPPFSCSQPTEPWCIFVAGAFGSNKRKTIVSLVETGRLPLLSFCYIDTDEISRHFPEYHVYIESTVPKNAIELTKKEAGLVAEILLWSALEAGKNVLYSGRLKHTIWYNQLFQKIRNKFSSVRIAILHIDAPLECLKARVAVCTII